MNLVADEQGPVVPARQTAEPLTEIDDCAIGGNSDCSNDRTEPAAPNSSVGNKYLQYSLFPELDD